MPRKIVKKPEHDRRRSIGWFAIEVIEHFLVHGKGDLMGEPARLLDETAEFIVDCYALDSDGKRLYSSAFFSRAKGFAKSELAAFLAIFEAIFPCRFERWAKGGEVFKFQDFTYVYEKGEPIGTGVVSPFIRCMATEETQVGNVYDTIHYNLSEGGSSLSALFKRDDVALSRIRIPWNGGEIVPSTSSSASKDGGKETFVVFDETHLYNTNSLRNMYATVSRNLRKRKLSEPWALETSTMFEPGENSVAEQTFEAAGILEEGKLVASDYLNVLFDHRWGFEDTDFEDAASIERALVEAYGDFAPFQDMESKVADFFDPRKSQSELKRYFLNQVVASDDAWIDPSLWLACELDEDDYNEDPWMPGDTIALGFDGSRGRKDGVADSTALVGVRLRDGLVKVFGLWEQPPGKAGEGWEAPEDEVNERVHEVFADYKVVAFYADPARWESVIAKWEAKYRNRLRTKASLAKPISWKMNDGAKSAQAVDLLKNAIIEQEVKHFAEPDLGKHIRNARAVKKRYGVALYKPVGQEERKIDAAIATVLAWQARVDALSVVKDKRKKRKPQPFRIR